MKRTIWTSITGSLTSAAPILFACCKSGACVGVCASPIASLFGVSSATLASSPWMSVIEPILIALSAVSFTVSYYSIYVLPKLKACGPDSCACEPTSKEKRRDKINKFVFWLGLILSLGFLSYFETTKYMAANELNRGECETECSPGSCGDEETAKVCTPLCDSTSSCCSHDEDTAQAISCKLAPAELKERKETVIAELKEGILEKKELSNGYTFKFNGDDETAERLLSFIKSERSCCNFLTFNLKVSGNKQFLWLDITGSAEAKKFITDQMDL